MNDPERDYIAQRFSTGGVEVDHKSLECQVLLTRKCTSNKLTHLFGMLHSYVSNIACTRLAKIRDNNFRIYAS